MEPIAGSVVLTNHLFVPASQTSLSAFACVFYALSPEYGCLTIVNMVRLQMLCVAKLRVIVLVKPDLPSSYLSTFTARKATVIRYEPPSNPTENVHYCNCIFL